jgi:NitT/TauT family transport system permease protein
MSLIDQGGTGGNAAALTHERVLLSRESRLFARRRRREKIRVLALQFALLAALLLVWWAISGTLVDSLFVSDPISVATAFYEIVANGQLWWHLQWTLLEMTLGYIVGVSVGLGLAFIVTALPWAQQILRPLMLGTFAIPKVALAPLIVVWFGIYLLPKIVLAASIVLFIVYFNTVAGIMAVNPCMIEVLRVMGASRLALLTKLTLPSAVPYIFVAMRITLPGALIGAIIGEFVSSNRGIGYLIAAASSRYDTAQVFAGILSLLVFVLLLHALLSRFEHHLARWQSSGEASMKP